MQTFRMNREEVVTAWQRDRQRLRRVLGMAKGMRDWIATHWYGAEWYRNLDEARRWSAAWKRAAKHWRVKGIFWRDVATGMERERDDSRNHGAQLAVELLNERLRKDELQAERDGLQRQLKEVADCIIHYAPTNFPMLQYDTAAEALSALLERNVNELATRMS